MVQVKRLPAAPPSDLDTELDAGIDNESIEAMGEDAHGIEGSNEVIDTSLLSAPPPRPGMTQMWVRTNTGGQPDSQNFGRQVRMGWQPRKANTVGGEFAAPTVRHSSYGDVIGIEGMILCEMPSSRWKAYQDHWEERRRSQMQAIERNLSSVEQPGHPILKAAKTTVTTGRKAEFLTDS